MNRDDEVRAGYAEDNPSDVLATMVTGSWLDSQEFPPLTYQVPGIIPEGFGLLSGPPKIGKSWLVANVGLAVASGGKALGRIAVTRRPVLYMALEDGHRRLQSRFRTIMVDQPLPADMHVIIHARAHQVPVMIEAFLDLHGDMAPLVILDTLGKVKPPRGPGEDSYSVDYAIGSRLKDIVDRVSGSTLLVVHHTRKAESHDFVDAVSGTQGIAGSADFVIVLARKRLSDEAVLAVTGRDINEAEYALTTDNGMWTLDGDDLTAAAQMVQTRRDEGHLSDRTLDVLNLVNSRPETRASDLKAIGLEANQARVYLNRLAEAGRIAKPGRGIYTAMPAQVPQLHLVTPAQNPVMSVASVTPNAGTSTDTTSADTTERNTHNGHNTVSPKDLSATAREVKTQRKENPR